MRRACEPPAGQRRGAGALAGRAPLHKTATPRSAVCILTPGFVAYRSPLWSRQAGKAAARALIWRDRVCAAARRAAAQPGLALGLNAWAATEQPPYRHTLGSSSWQGCRGGLRSPCAQPFARCSGAPHHRCAQQRRLGARGPSRRPRCAEASWPIHLLPNPRSCLPPSLPARL